jgi:hypothetical protein
MQNVSKGGLVIVSEETIRVLRILEYVGPRERVEDTLTRSQVPLNGTAPVGCGSKGIQIKSAMIGPFPDVVQRDCCWFDGRRVSRDNSEVVEAIADIFAKYPDKEIQTDVLLQYLVTEKLDFTISQVLHALRHLRDAGTIIHIDINDVTVDGYVHHTHPTYGKKEATGDAPSPATEA